MELKVNSRLHRSKTKDSHIKNQVSWRTVMRQMLPVSKEVFNLIPMTKMAAVGMHTNIYRHSEALNVGFFQVK